MKPAFSLSHNGWPKMLLRDCPEPCDHVLGLHGRRICLYQSIDDRDAIFPTMSIVPRPGTLSTPAPVPDLWNSTAAPPWANERFRRNAAVRLVRSTANSAPSGRIWSASLASTFAARQTPATSPACRTSPIPVCHAREARCRWRRGPVRPRVGARDRAAHHARRFRVRRAR